MAKATGAGYPRPPEPPADLHAISPDCQIIGSGERLYRIHRIVHAPIFFGPPGPHPECRFDDPGGVYKTLYAGRSVAACFAETALRDGGRSVTQAWLESRHLSTLPVIENLVLVALHGPGLNRVGATAQIVSGPHAVAQRWAHALHDHPDSPDGIAYRCRHDDGEFAVALFDRAARKLGAAATARLNLFEDADILDPLLDRYDVALLR